MEKGKIMVTVLSPVMDRIDEKMQSLGMRRDAYLNGLLDTQIEQMSQDLKGKSNSNKAREYLLGELKAKRMPTRSMSLALNRAVIARIDKVCKETNLARDCFINRVLYFLSAEAKHLKNIGIDAANDREGLSVNSLDAASELISDPFHDLQMWLKRTNPQMKFYEWQFGDPLIGLNCIIEDSLISGDVSLQEIGI